MFNKLSEEDSYIVFQIDKTNFGIKSKWIQELTMVENITPVPNVPSYIEGITLSRGNVIPVINLRMRFGLPKKDYDLKTRMIVVTLDNRKVGIIVDSAREYIYIPPEKIQPPPERMFTISSNFLEGIANLDNRIILLLNIKAILESSEEINFTGGFDYEKKEK